MTTSAVEEPSCISHTENKSSLSMKDRATRRPSSPCPRSSSNKSKRKSTSLPPETVEYLKNWMMSPEHIAHPYPTEQEKTQIMKETGIELKQLTNWFVNNRKRYWKPRVEARLQEQAKALAPATTPSLPMAPTVKIASPMPVSPTGRQSSLIHVVSTPNVLALEEEQLLMSPASSSSSSSFTTISSQADFLCSSSESSTVDGMIMEDSDDNMSTGQATTEQTLICKETVSIHIFQPADGSNPTLEHVVVGNIDDRRRDSVLRTYVGCDLQYVRSTRKQNDMEREAQVILLKKRYLDLYLSSDLPVRASNKRKEVETEEVATPRPKYRRRSVEIWRKACEEAHHGYCDTLPTLEEAARLFGYAT